MLSIYQKNKEIPYVIVHVQHWNKEGINKIIVVFYTGEDAIKFLVLEQGLLGVMDLISSQTRLQFSYFQELY